MTTLASKKPLNKYDHCSPCIQYVAFRKGWAPGCFEVFRHTPDALNLFNYAGLFQLFTDTEAGLGACRRSSYRGPSRKLKLKNVGASPNPPTKLALGYFALFMHTASFQSLPQACFETDLPESWLSQICLLPRSTLVQSRSDCTEGFCNAPKKHRRFSCLFIECPKKLNLSTAAQAATKQQLRHQAELSLLVRFHTDSTSS